jgi:hypothetical protein
MHRPLHKALLEERHQRHPRLLLTLNPPSAAEAPDAAGGRRDWTKVHHSLSASAIPPAPPYRDLRPPGRGLSGGRSRKTWSGAGLVLVVRPCNTCFRQPTGPSSAACGSPGRAAPTALIVNKTTNSRTRPCRSPRLSQLSTFPIPGTETTGLPTTPLIYSAPSSYMCSTSCARSTVHPITGRCPMG